MNGAASHMSHHTGHSIRILREAAGLELEALAFRARIKPSYLARVESGEAIPSGIWLAHTSGVIAAAFSATGD